MACLIDGWSSQLLFAYGKDFSWFCAIWIQLMNDNSTYLKFVGSKGESFTDLQPGCQNNL